jgi:hypothetical protein
LVGCPDKKKIDKIALEDDKHSSALEMVVPIGEARIRVGFDLNMEDHGSSKTKIDKY